VLPFFSFFFILPPPRSTLFPYTTLFRSAIHQFHGHFQPGFLNRGKIHQFAELLKIVRLRINRFALIRPNDRCLEVPFLPLQNDRSEEHTSELQSRGHLVCRLLLEKKKNI